MVSLTWRPRMPPWAFTSLAHSWYPRSNAWPSAEKSPASDSDAPMVIGPVGCLVGAGIIRMRPRPHLRWLYRSAAFPAVECGEFPYSGPVVRGVSLGADLHLVTTPAASAVHRTRV